MKNENEYKKDGIPYVWLVTIRRKCEKIYYYLISVLPFEQRIHMGWKIYNQFPLKICIIQRPNDHRAPKIAGLQIISNEWRV